MPRYVILEHRRDGVHWDFMVEPAPGAPLRTWAIAATPAADVDLAATPLPDHRPIYLEYEGEISGGRGSVSRWDEGACAIDAWTDGHVRLTLDGRQGLGSAEFSEGGGGGGAGGSSRTSGIESASGAGGWVVRFGKLR